MAWVAPPTFVSGAALTAAQLNILSGDLNESAAAKATAGGQIFVSTAANAIAARTPGKAYILTNETTTSTTYADLTTLGPQVTLTTGTSALVAISADFSCNTVGASSLISYNMPAPTSTAPDDGRAIACRAAAINTGIHASFVMLETLGGGSQNFKMLYRTGAGTSAFQSRQISVIPL